MSYGFGGSGPAGPPGGGNFGLGAAFAGGVGAGNLSGAASKLAAKVQALENKCRSIDEDARKLLKGLTEMKRANLVPAGAHGGGATSASSPNTASPSGGVPPVLVIPATGNNIDGRSGSPTSDHVNRPPSPNGSGASNVGAIKIGNQHYQAVS
ncbi:unnamed protein product [Amoebophrya sp. A25]|nr:unnamed protein product [Amoebophrya sp. A25]|eukprot:GSA25T00009056001.1